MHSKGNAQELEMYTVIAQNVDLSDAVPLHVLFNNAVYCQDYIASLKEWISMVHFSNDTNKIKVKYETQPHTTSSTKNPVPERESSWAYNVRGRHLISSDMAGSLNWPIQSLLEVSEFLLEISSHKYLMVTYCIAEMQWPSKTGFSYLQDLAFDQDQDV